MKITQLKFMVPFILLSSIMFISACSKANNNTVENDEEQPTVNEQTNENNIEVDELSTNIESLTYETIDIPTSLFAVSNINGDSFFHVSEIGGDSEINREMIEVLTEFEAEEINEGTKLTLPEDILFDYDSSELRDDADEAIQKLVYLAEEIDGDITIIGHTDSRGDDEYNQNLSESRAEAVVKALIDSDVKEKRLIAKGKGATEPVAENTKSDGSDNPEGREKNRRVEILIHGLEY